MPSDAPSIKRERVARDGAEIVTVGPSSGERQRMAESLASERGLAVIPPFDDDRIIAGQGTCGLEIAEDLPDVAAVLIPVGGGGLASGVSVAMCRTVPMGHGPTRYRGAASRRGRKSRSTERRRSMRQPPPVRRLAIARSDRPSRAREDGWR